ncbi:hypothetical protein [Burkholderia lata]|uniref:hypothetical protein n=1 Tax=Burkholderia lata (strain ATCC 17760 / DSM 23089 / LMG 22485 / NCIMB 9086 / R18194 / 383) TaxID=482957 RepID=UPI0015830A63|nr:hypothetical protein [Burkholderia lata]
MQKHKIRPRGFLIPENPVFTLLTSQTKSRLSAVDLQPAIFSSTMNSPDNAISERFDPQARRTTHNMKRLRLTQAASTTDGESCTQPTVKCAGVQFAAFNG